MDIGMVQWIEHKPVKQEAASSIPHQAHAWDKGQVV